MDESQGSNLWVILVVGGAVAVGLAAVIFYQVQHSKRRRGYHAAAALHGFASADGDPFNCTRLNFSLFRKGDRRGIDRIMYRDDDTKPVLRAFDYYYHRETTEVDEFGREKTTRSGYRHFTCVLLQTNGGFPVLKVQPERALTRLRDAVGMRDIQLELEQFNRAFDVRCHDPRFANTLLDQRMQEFLLAIGADFSYEFHGRWMLMWRPWMPPDMIPSAMALAERVAEKIPPVTFSLYPTLLVDDDGNPLPVIDEVYRPGQPDRDPWDAVVQSPFAGIWDGPDRPQVEYDLDGNVIEKIEEDPWGDLDGTGRLKDPDALSWPSD